MPAVPLESRLLHSMYLLAQLALERSLTGAVCQT